MMNRLPTACLVASGLITMSLSVQSQDLGEVLGLRWCEDSKDCLEWETLPAASGYLVHRGDGASLADLATGEIDSCIVAEPRAPRTGRVLGDAPPAGGLQWFLVTANEESRAGAARVLDSSGPCCAARVVDEDFAGLDAASWPSSWEVLGGVDLAEIRGGMSQLRPTPSGYSLARMGLAGDWRDVEVTFTVSYEDLATQGVGFCVRQDGGYLGMPFSPASGHAVFIEGFRGTDGIGIWKEQDGNEIDLLINFDDALGLVDDTRFRVRFRCQQISATTTDLRARIWREDEAEPQRWDVQIQDSSPEQQGLSGGIAIDSWSSIQAPNPITAFTAVSDVVVTPLCNPLEGLAPVETVSEAFASTEGPAWSGSELYFSDPPYGLPSPADREIPFNGLFRVTPAGEVIAEWMGDPDATRPNGVLLSPGGGTLYMADSAQGTVLAFPVDEDGSLGAGWTLATGLTTPDGLSVDRHGNLYVATWASTIEVFSPNGGRWGSIPIPRQATNCTFGDQDLQTLYVTAQQGLYAVRLSTPGVAGP